MKTGLIILLLSGVVLVSCKFTRHFHLVNQKLTWSDAQRHCRTHFTDLATIQDSEQHHNAKVVAGSKVVWIGMFQDFDWSVADEDVRLLTGFTNWNPDNPQTLRSVTISGNGKWDTRKWIKQYSFICYKGTADSHFLVPELLNWEDARDHCRRKMAELSRISNKQENKFVAALVTKNGYSHAWIGLSKSSWRWSNGETVSYDNWGESSKLQLPRCVLLNGKWYAAHCGSKQYTLCYTDVPHIGARSVKIQLSGGSADLNHPAVRDSILQQLKQKLEEQDLRGVKLRWKIQPDGKVFHKKEEERAPPSGYCEDVNLSQPDH